jgi:hypothetical protein
VAQEQPLTRIRAPRRRVIVVAAVTAAAVLVGVAGYRVLTDGDAAETGGAVKSGTGELRSDLDPLVKRFPVLGEPSEARWMSGTYGRSDVPGPSTYWIDAVVTLAPEKVEQLRSAYAPTANGKTPDVTDGMRGQLPSGPFLTGDALDAAFGRERWHASAYLDPDSGEIVLVATGT